MVNIHSTAPGAVAIFVSILTVEIKPVTSSLELALFWTSNSSLTNKSTYNILRQLKMRTF